MNQEKSQEMRDVREAGTINQPPKGYWVKDISASAAEFGFPFRILVTMAVWERCLIIPDDCPREREDERLLALLAAFDDACMEYAGEGEVSFVLPIANGGDEPIPVTLRAVFRHSEEGELVFLLKLEEEE